MHCNGGAKQYSTYVPGLMMLSFAANVAEVATATVNIAYSTKI